MSSELADLYQEVVLDHGKRPRNFGPLEGATHHAEGLNPLCGDHFTVHAKVEDGVVREARFEGSGCAISKASASVMTGVVKGKTREEIERIFERFHRRLVDTRRRIGTRSHHGACHGKKDDVAERRPGLSFKAGDPGPVRRDRRRPLRGRARR